MNTYWQKQTKDNPLFPDLLWSRPENKRLAGKLLVIGGNLHAVSAPSSAYNYSMSAGIGVAKVILPDALKKTFAKIIPDCEFAPSTPSGSFAKQSLELWLDLAQWSDAVLLAGDLGRNSETAILIEEFVGKYKQQLILTQDALDIFAKNPKPIINRPKTLIVGAFDQLQKILSKVPSDKGVLKYSNTLNKNIEVLAEISSKIPAHIITKHQNQLIAALNGKIASSLNEDEIWRVKIAASAGVWWLQNPDKPFEAVATSLIS